jgi:hypothetical protein
MNGEHAMHVARRSLVGLQSCKLNDMVGTGEPFDPATYVRLDSLDTSTAQKIVARGLAKKTTFLAGGIDIDPLTHTESNLRTCCRALD